MGQYIQDVILILGGVSLFFILCSWGYRLFCKSEFFNRLYDEI